MTSTGLARVTLFLITLCGDVIDALAAPNPRTLGSDLTILTHNDLYAATLVLGAWQPHDKAQTTCEQLSEDLWEPDNSTDFGFLMYLKYSHTSEKPGLYWIGGRALCSQSAVLSFPEKDDTSEKWQVAVNAGTASILGSRDKLSFRFRGIKYAAEPQRFTYSKYKEPDGNISALTYGSGCINTYCGTTLDCREDCLFLNIWTPTLPAKKSAKKKAVMF
ncbi:uncharacterized protein yc1106_06686 [Curvularia clavata]|uniref:Carboxylesterase type B domain-containing protein n=1 Tax=Curvularia clavata TaxID=95742 RepID=A0A9Q8ZC75_CURCL|nr:uncharacterized protein yc1106_06686 [Curvularia clavata]